MENSNLYTAEELQKCPYHSPKQAAASNNDNDPREKPNTGDWGDIDDDDEAEQIPTVTRMKETTTQAEQEVAEAQLQTARILYRSAAELKISSFFNILIDKTRSKKQ